jgi:hypothetical protein
VTLEDALTSTPILASDSSTMSTVSFR